MKVKRSINEIKPVLLEIKKILKNIYADRLTKIILYGSFARDEATIESDIDIAVVLRGRINKIKEIDKIHDVIYPLTIEYGELISVNPMSEEEIKDVEWPLYYHIQNEGITV